MHHCHQRFYAIIFFLYSISLLSQEDDKVKITFSGYLDAYYSYHSNQPKTEQANSFLYNYNRHNEFNLNIVLLRANLDYKNAYASLAMHSGTYVEDNYANEKIKYINEAFVVVNRVRIKRTPLKLVLCLPILVLKQQQQLQI